MRVLVTGAGGQVAEAVCALRPCDAEVRALSRAELDIADATAVAGAVAAFEPQIIINAAAFTAVDRAESEPALAASVNTAGPAHLAEAAARLPGCRLLHISTDYVFDGAANRPYRTDDQTHPLGVYGQTKLDGEHAVLSRLPGRAAVLRTAWVYAAHGRNFLLTMLRLMRERGLVRVVCDQTGSPTSVMSIAQLLWRLADTPSAQGLFHWTDSGVASWHDFARAIALEAAGLGMVKPEIRVESITTADYPTPARRPAYSVLDCEQTAVQLGIAQSPWRTRLRETLKKLADASAA